MEENERTFLNNKFDRFQYFSDEPNSELRVKHVFIHPKTIINKVNSPDVPADYSMNPYQGCEHGCTYCYARNSHEYWGYNPAQDFERVLLIKKNAPLLFEKEIRKKSWTRQPIMLSGNTDCYQPIEREYQLTRKILSVANKYNQPISIITKNALILRDMDILSEMARKGILKVNVSINSTDEEIRRKLEPRTSTTLKRLNAVKRLSDAGIETRVLIAPVIPGLNDTHVPELVKLASDNGAFDVSFITVRLNGSIGDIFKQWAKDNFPNKYDKLVNQIGSLNKGSLSNNKFGKRMTGEGIYAEIIKKMFIVAKKKYFGDKIKKESWPDDRTNFQQLNIF